MFNSASLRREWLSNPRGDILAGIVVALAHIPEAIGFSVIAGVDPRVGLHSDAARMIVWGDEMAGGTTVSDTTQNGNYAVYGRVSARQNLPAGSYTESIAVTFTY